MKKTLSRPLIETPKWDLKLVRGALIGFTLVAGSVGVINSLEITPDNEKGILVAPTCETSE